MKNTYRKIGEEWVNLEPLNILWVSDFTRSPLYESYIEKGKSLIDYYVSNNKTMLSLVSESTHGDNYALRQLIYRDSKISECTSCLQRAGRRYYRDEAIKRIKAAIAPEYVNLPEFFRSAYSIDDIALSYFSEVTADWKNQINKAATAYFYQIIRGHIGHIL